MRRSDWSLTERGFGLDQMIECLREMQHAGATFEQRMDAVTAAFTESLRESMPVRSGNLKRSGYWTSEMSSDIYEATVQFGGWTAPYAPYVIGRFVNGEHGWDEVLPAFEPVYEAVIASEFHA